MRKKWPFRKLRLLLWLGACVAVLCWTWWARIHSKTEEPQIAMVLFMILLSFPSGVAVAAIWTGLGFVAIMPALRFVTQGNVGFILLWFSFVVAGYLQWFVALPENFKKL